MRKLAGAIGGDARETATKASAEMFEADQVSKTCSTLESSKAHLRKARQASCIHSACFPLHNTASTPCFHTEPPQTTPLTPNQARQYRLCRSPSSPFEAQLSLSLPTHRADAPLETYNPSPITSQCAPQSDPPHAWRSLLSRPMTRRRSPRHVAMDLRPHPPIRQRSKPNSSASHPPRHHHHHHLSPKRKLKTIRLDLPPVRHRTRRSHLCAL